MEQTANVDEEIKARAWTALDDVIDPELGLPVTDLGLVYGLEVEDGAVSVELTTTTPICPLGDYLLGQAKDRLLKVEGVSTVDIVLTQDPPWTIDRLSERALQHLGQFW